MFDKCFRDILCIQFIDKTTHLKFAICVYYLPPENNVNGRFTADFFDYLTNLLYRLDDHELCMCIGDASARCGDESDLIALVHDGNIPQRSYVDDQKNSGGPVFIDFLKRVQCCMLTGRFDTGNNNFTCISHIGRYVVDYYFLPRCFYNNVKSFNTSHCL